MSGKKRGVNTWSGRINGQKSRKKNRAAPEGPSSGGDYRRKKDKTAYDAFIKEDEYLAEVEESFVKISREYM